MNKILVPCLCALVATGCAKTDDYDAFGIFEANTVTVSAETTGRLLQLAPMEGDNVFDGQTLAVVDTVMLVLQRKQLAQQQQAIESNAPDVASQASALRAQIAHAQQELDRVQHLYSDSAATNKQLDDARAQVRVLHSQLEAQLSSLDKSRAATSDNALGIQYQREQVEEQIAKCTVTSPLSGSVLSKFAQPGEFVAPGKALYKIADLKHIYLRAYFTSAQLSDIKLGQDVTVIADFGADKKFEYPGKISWIAQESEFTPKSIQTDQSRANLVYAVKIAVENDGRIKLGQYGEVRL